MRKKKIVILLGAGSAIPWGAPTTSQITETIINDTTFKTRTGQPLGSWFYNRLIQFYHKDPQNVNFETILNSIDWLNSYFHSLLSSGGSRFKVMHPAFLKENEDIYEFLDFNRIYPKENKHWKAENSKYKFYGWWDDYDTFFEQVYRYFINIIVYSIANYQNQCSSEKNFAPNNLLNSFLNELNQSSVIRIYSLNYDNLIPKVSDLNFFQGFSSINEVLKFDRKKVYEKTSINSFYNLHGSIYYELDFPSNVKFTPNHEVYSFGSGASDGNDQESRKLINSNIITGLNKANRLLLSPYLQFYNSFQNDCHNANQIICVGYSFSDIHINRIIEESSIYNKKQSVVAVDYNIHKGENINKEYHYDFFRVYGDDRYSSQFLDNSHKIYNIGHKENSERIFYFRKGFEKFMEWKKWKL